MFEAHRQKDALEWGENEEADRDSGYLWDWGALKRAPKVGEYLF